MQSLRGDCMMTRHQGPIPEPIAQLQQQLNQWRSTNRPRTRLPEPFWSAPEELARHYGIYQTAHAPAAGLRGPEGAAARIAKHTTEAEREASQRHFCRVGHGTHGQ